MPKQAAWKRHVAVVAAVLSLASLTVAFAQPKDTVNVPRERATVVVAIDVSRSMEATDVEPNRLEAAKAAAQDFVDMLPRGFNVSLVAFAGSSSIIAPPTQDRGLIKRAIDNLQLAPSTAIGEGIYSSLDAMAAGPAGPRIKPDEPTPGRDRAAVGRLHQHRPLLGGGRARRPRSCRLPDLHDRLRHPQRVRGQQRTPRARAGEPGRAQATVARESGGEAFKAGSANELQKVYASIARSVGYEKVDQEVTEFYTGIALGFAVLASLAVLSLAARWP